MPTNDSNRLPASFTAFGGTRLLATGPIEAIVLPAQQWLAAKAGPLLILDDLSGQPIDLDLRGSEADALERLKEHPGFRRPGDGEVPRAGRGRPKLGVVPREVTLLPRHWDWLNEQPGGASVTLRKLVEGAMKRGQGADRARRAREAAFRALGVLAGDRPGYEEVSRALTRREYGAIAPLTDDWPPDVRDYLRALVERAHQAEQEAEHEPA